MKKLEECKEYFKDLHTDVLVVDGFGKSLFDCVELARYNTHCETLKFIYGEEFDRMQPRWVQESLNEFYSK